MVYDMTLHGLKRKTITAYVAGVTHCAGHFGKCPVVLGTAEIRSYPLCLTHGRQCWELNQAMLSTPAESESRSPASWRAKTCCTTPTA